MIARLEVTRGSLTEYPLAEKVCGGWQNGVMFYPDAEVTKVTPLIFRNETPTDDDQDALAQIVCRALEHQDGGEECEVDFAAADAILAGGFRRSEVPEPRAWHDVAAFLERRGLADGGIADFIRENAPEPQGEPSNRVIVMCARCGLFPVVGGDEINSDIVVCDRCAFAEGRESAQGEPSDAGVDDAWWKAQEAGQLPRTPGPSIRQAFKAGYRAALRAAGGVR